MGQILKHVSEARFHHSEAFISNMKAALRVAVCAVIRKILTYYLNIGITSVRNKVFCGDRFYCALLTLHVSVQFGGHLQVVRKHKKYLRQSLYIQRIR
jgi:hypothetical protein